MSRRSGIVPAHIGDASGRFGRVWGGIRGTPGEIGGVSAPVGNASRRFREASAGFGGAPAGVRGASGRFRARSGCVGRSSESWKRRTAPQKDAKAAKLQGDSRVKTPRRRGGREARAKGAARANVEVPDWSLIQFLLPWSPLRVSASLREPFPMFLLSLELPLLPEAPSPPRLARRQRLWQVLSCL